MNITEIDLWRNGHYLYYNRDNRARKKCLLDTTTKFSSKISEQKETPATLANFSENESRT